jgi:hypothetical protein
MDVDPTLARRAVEASAMGRTLVLMDERRRLERDIGALSWQAFQRLVHDLAKKEWPEALALAAPDGGADSLVPAKAEQPSHVIQAKHYPAPGQIKWSECVKSLAAALVEHTPGRLTFVFSRDFNKHHLRAFRARLIDPNPGAEVRAWTLTDVCDLLDRYPDIKTRYFGRDREDVLESIRRALELGGKLETGADLIEQAGRLGEFTEDHDSDFSYGTYTGGASMPEPKWDDGDRPFMTVLVKGEKVTVYVNAWLREGAEAATHFTFTEDEAGTEAREHAREELAAGREATLTAGVQVNIVNPPKVLREAMGDRIETEEITLQPGRPSSVEIEVTGADGVVTSDVWEFRPIPPRMPGHLALGCVVGALSVELTLALLEEPMLRFEFNAEGHFRADVAANVAAARFLHRIFNHRGLVFRSNGFFPTGGLPCDTLPADEEKRQHIAARLAFYEDLEFIEQRCGVDFDIPSPIDEEDMAAIATVVGILRTGRGTATFHGGDGTVKANEVPRAAERFETARFHRRPVEYSIFGQEVNLGLGEYKLPRVKVVEVIPHGATPGAPARVKVVADGSDQMPFRLFDAPAEDESEPAR